MPGILRRQRGAPHHTAVFNLRRLFLPLPKSSTAHRELLLLCTCCRTPKEVTSSAKAQSGGLRGAAARGGARCGATHTHTALKNSQRAGKSLLCCTNFSAAAFIVSSQTSVPSPSPAHRGPPLKWLLITSWSRRRLNFARRRARNAECQPAEINARQSAANSCDAQFVEIVAAGCSSPCFHHTNIFGGRLIDGAVLPRTIYSQALVVTPSAEMLHQSQGTSLLRAQLLQDKQDDLKRRLHRPSVTEITSSASFPKILSNVAIREVTA